MRGRSGAEKEHKHQFKGLTNGEWGWASLTGFSNKKSFPGRFQNGLLNPKHVILFLRNGLVTNVNTDGAITARFPIMVGGGKGVIQFNIRSRFISSFLLPFAHGPFFIVVGKMTLQGIRRLRSA